jgi:hypothetical protein
VLKKKKRQVRAISERERDRKKERKKEKAMEGGEAINHQYV